MDLGVAAEGRRLGHKGPPSQDGLATYPATAHLPGRPRRGHRFAGYVLCVTSETFAADVKSETMAITDPGNPGNIGKK
jgi:hypothetical protein